MAEKRSHCLLQQREMIRYFPSWVPKSNGASISESTGNNRQGIAYTVLPATEFLQAQGILGRVKNEIRGVAEAMSSSKRSRDVDPIMICTDLDRTLLPNGNAPETEGARSLFHRMVHESNAWLVYVTGRHIQLVDEAIHDYDVPLPHFAVTDVGSRIYYSRKDRWESVSEWDDIIEQSMKGFRLQSLKKRLQNVKYLELQEPPKQNIHKLSYYIIPYDSLPEVQTALKKSLEPDCPPVKLVWSRDASSGYGLLDILPAYAGKLDAVCYLIKRQGIPHDRVVFAGDSGNDLDVLQSEIRGIIVANADTEIKTRARSAVKDATRLYIADGRLGNLNGNYSAGIIEGIVHYFPELHLPEESDD
jgi:sucrose-6-phosphatase